MGALTWLGQAGFLLETDQTRMVIDLFLSPLKGRIPSPIGVGALGRIDWALVTHEHADHWDGPALAELHALWPQMGVVIPEPMKNMALGRGFRTDRVVTAVPDLGFQLGTVRVMPVRSAHGRHVKDGYGFGESQGQVLGYCLTLDGVVIYHSGDTVCYPGMIDRLPQESIQVALLPINGRDFFREQADIVGNLTEREAVELAAEIGARTVIPMHYDAMPNNSGDIGLAARVVRERWPELTFIAPGYGHRLTLSPPSESRR